MSIYQDVSDAELARERRYEKRRERAAKIERKRRVADLRFAEECEFWLGEEPMWPQPAPVWVDIPVGYSNAR